MGILVVGSVAFDSVETPFGKVDEALGGSATYFPPPRVISRRSLLSRSWAAIFRKSTLNSCATRALI